MESVGGTEPARIVHLEGEATLNALHALGLAGMIAGPAMTGVGSYMMSDGNPDNDGLAAGLFAGGLATSVAGSYGVGRAAGSDPTRFQRLSPVLAMGSSLVVAPGLGMQLAGGGQHQTVSSVDELATKRMAEAAAVARETGGTVELDEDAIRDQIAAFDTDAAHGATPGDGWLTITDVLGMSADKGSS